MSTSTEMSSKMSSVEDQATCSGGTRISHAPSHNKRQKMTKSDVLVGEKEEDVLTSILPLRLAVLGGYLPLKDTGRFLLRVGKGTTASIFEERVTAAVGGTGEAAGDATVVPDDGTEAIDAETNATLLRQGMSRNEAWKFLCEQKWRNASTLEHLVFVLGDGEIGVMTVWERLFRKFLPSPPKPPVRESVEDYSFVFVLKKCNETERDLATPLTTFVLKGDEAIKFLKTGESEWLKLDSPMLLGNFEVDSFEEQWANQSQNMISTLHALRKSDGKSCEIDYQTDLEHFYDDPNRIDICFSGNVISVSDLETITRSRSMIDERGMTIDQNLRITYSKKCAGSSEYTFAITHIHFLALLFDADGDSSEFTNRSNELATGVTVADFISRFDVEWK